MSEEQWNLAWSTYISVYLAKYPKDLQDILTYQLNIHHMMPRKANWYLYEYKFRVDRENSKCRWNTVRNDLDRDAYLNASRRADKGSLPSTFRSHVGPSSNTTGSGLAQGVCLRIIIPNLIARSPIVNFATNVRSALDHIPCTNTTIPPCQEARPLPTPRNVTEFSHLLDGFDGKKFVVDGFQKGFLLGFKGKDAPLISHNPSSTLVKPDFVTNFISRELLFNRIAGPFATPLLPNFKSFLISLLEKKGDWEITNDPQSFVSL